MEFVARTSIAVEDTEGRIAQWSGRTMEYMAKKLSMLSEVRFLRVCGRVCHVALPNGLQQHPPQNVSNRPISIRYVYFGADLTRLQALARKRRILRVEGHFMFLGWIISIMDRSGVKTLKRGRLCCLALRLIDRTWNALICVWYGLILYVLRLQAQYSCQATAPGAGHFTTFGFHRGFGMCRFDDSIVMVEKYRRLHHMVYSSNSGT